MKIKIFSTGGTIAKKYNELNGELVFDKDHLCKMLDQGRFNVSNDLVPLMLKDSLDMDDSDRQIIFEACMKSDDNKILITHGTDTMVDTAKKLSTIKNKTVVLVGAMIPYAFKNSDAMFNLGVSIGAVQTLEKGTYICMNGQVFSWDKVEKNRQKGMFEAK